MNDDHLKNKVAYRLKVEFAILGSDQDFTKINSMLGENAKHYARKGQSIEGRPIARQNVWAYWGDKPSENAELAEQWKPVGRLINNRQSEILLLSKMAKLKIAIVVHAFDGYPALLLQPDMIDQLHQVGASLDIDVYGALTGEVF